MIAEIVIICLARRVAPSTGFEGLAPLAKEFETPFQVYSNQERE